MVDTKAQLLAVGRKLLIPLLAVLGGFLAAMFPMEFAAMCKGVL